MVSVTRGRAAGVLITKTIDDDGILFVALIKINDYTKPPTTTTPLQLSVANYRTVVSTLSQKCRCNSLNPPQLLFLPAKQLSHLLLTRTRQFVAVVLLWVIKQAVAKFKRFCIQFGSIENRLFYFGGGCQKRPFNPLFDDSIWRLVLMPCHLSRSGGGVVCGKSPSPAQMLD